jgi:hypothetical protein
MAMLPSGIVVSTTGVYTNYPTEKFNGGVMFGISDGTPVNTNLVTRRLTIRDSAVPNSLSRPVEASGTNHAYSAAKVRSGGTFAYDGNNSIIRGVTASINGTASTALLINGNEQFRDRRRLLQKSFGAKTSTAWRAGYFRWTRTFGSSNPRSAWSTTPTVLNDTFRSTTNNGTNSDDQGQFVTFRSIPGELVYRIGAPAPFQDDYKPITG